MILPPLQTPAPLRVPLVAARIPNARVPDESRSPLVPQPMTAALHPESPVEITGAWSLPVGVFDHYDDFRAALARRFTLPAPTAKTKKVAIDGGVSKLGFNPGGYRITIRPDGGITVVGEEDTGMRNAAERLAALAFAKDGKLWLPTGYLYDNPKVYWRGVHLFVGPQARPFQRRLWTRVLRPLGFDHVVLQCERTAWDATPGTATAITTPKAELGSLFKTYRDLGVDAVPLIQSYGHMEWLFANNQNRDLVMNPEVPYAIDPRKPRAKETLTKVWEEAIALAHPKTVHFGLDEVTMRGWTGGDAFLTDTWKTHLAFLNDLARKNGVEPMLWADQALFKTEAPDAAFAATLEDAKARRAAIPKYSYIADWHYKDDPKPETFAPVIQLWKDLGMRPIAATWLRPDNIRGYALAAGLLNAGLLQTTWAGYESNEGAMLEHFDQFSAMVLAADYAWSGRKEMPKDLPYDPADVFRRLYFGRPSPLTPQPGTALGGTTPFVVDGIGFRKLDLASESEIDLDATGKGRELDLALATDKPLKDGDAALEVTVERPGLAPLTQRLAYGRDLRALGDIAPLSRAERVPLGPSCARFDLGKPATAVGRITVRLLMPGSGLRVMGATLVD